jgi:hypothetical protein
MADSGSAESHKGKFEPKKAVTLNPPKDDPITGDYLSKCNGMNLEFQQSLFLNYSLPPQSRKLIKLKANHSEGTTEGHPTYVAIKVNQSSQSFRPAKLERFQIFQI